MPEREGSYGRWPDFDVSGVSSDLTVEAVYAPWVTVTASEEQSGKLSLALAEGRFTGEAVLHVADSRQEPPPEAGEGAVVWAISLTGTGLGADDVVPLRLLSPGGGPAGVWQQRDGQWRPVEATLNGQYLLVDMTGTQGVFCIAPQAEVPWLLPAALGAGGLAVLLLVLLNRRRKKKRAVPAGDGQEEPEPAAKS